MKRWKHHSVQPVRVRLKVQRRNGVLKLAMPAQVDHVEIDATWLCCAIARDEKSLEILHVFPDTKRVNQSVFTIRREILHERGVIPHLVRIERYLREFLN